MIPVIIPAYEPDDRLICLLNGLSQQMNQPIVVVDDGSGEKFSYLFLQAETIIKSNKGVVIHHDINKGKGCALITAFNYVLNEWPNSIGVVTADSDGQHSVDCIKKIADELRKNKDKLVLGARNFGEEGIPWKSRLGNRITKKVFEYVSGLHISDTQTGLRGIPLFFVDKLRGIKGERFEFETEMLLETYGVCEIIEIPIETIYDSKENHQTHFKPITDSIKIYSILGKRFFKFIYSSFSSCMIDLVLFYVLCLVLKNVNFAYVAISTLIARIISATYNYMINYKIVFRSNASIGISSVKYLALAIVQMFFSASMVTIGVCLFPKITELIIKVIVDTILFFVSYKIQQDYIFKKV